MSPKVHQVAVTQLNRTLVRIAKLYRAGDDCADTGSTFLGERLMRRRISAVATSRWRASVGSLSSSWTLQVRSYA